MKKIVKASYKAAWCAYQANNNNGNNNRKNKKMLQYNNDNDDDVNISAIELEGF